MTVSPTAAVTAMGVVPTHSHLLMNLWRRAAKCWPCPYCFLFSLSWKKTSTPAWLSLYVHPGGDPSQRHGNSPSLGPPRQQRKAAMRDPHVRLPHVAGKKRGTRCRPPCEGLSGWPRFRAASGCPPTLNSIPRRVQEGRGGGPDGDPAGQAPPARNVRRCRRSSVGAGHAVDDEGSAPPGPGHPHATKRGAGQELPLPRRAEDLSARLWFKMEARRGGHPKPHDLTGHWSPAHPKRRWLVGGSHPTREQIPAQWHGCPSLAQPACLAGHPTPVWRPLSKFES